MRDQFFITGISTDVGKTLVSAILVEALKADYWKPIQAGDLENSDKKKVESLISNGISKCHPEVYRLKTPMSPHAAAKIDGLFIDKNKINDFPNIKNTLVIEGAGGILVPINERDMVIDLIPKEARVIVVSRHYLGSINHTLMTLEMLKQKKFKITLIFNGKENTSTEEIIEKISGIKSIGRINEEPFFDKKQVMKYADMFRDGLSNLLKNTLYGFEK